MVGITLEGFEPKKLPQIKIDMEAGIRVILGANATLLPDSPEGQQISLFASVLADMWEQLHGAYSAFNPLAVTGQDQDDLYFLNGVIRSAPAPSEVILSITGVDGTVIPQNSIIAHDTSGAEFLTQTAVTIGTGFTTGTAQVLAKAAVNGKTVALAGSLTVISTPVNGWTTVTNDADATLGRLIETSAEFSAKREKSFALAGSNMLESVQAAVSSLEGVTEVKAYENFNDIADSNGLPPHSIELIVSGGTDAQIGQAIFGKRTSGIEPFGAVSVPVVDIFGGSHTMFFERPVQKLIYLRANITFIDQVPSGADGIITQNILDYVAGLLIPGYKIGISDDVFNSRMYVPVNHSYNNLTINSLDMSLDGAAWNTNDIVVAHDELASFDAARILLTIG